MNWNSGFSSRYYYTVVDPVSWRDIETHEIISGSISKSGSSLQESADLTLSDAPSNVESWIRIWVDAKQDEAGERSALFTGLLHSHVYPHGPARRDHFGAVDRDA